MKLVHKSPPLDLVGWYALVPKTGPTALHLPIHRQITAVNESAVLLGFHVEDVLSPAPGDPLPITIYDSNVEAHDAAREAPEGEDKEMRDAEAPAAAARMVLRFRKLPYTTETGEAEMIAMQFVREGGANAMVDATTTERHILEQFDRKIAVDDGKGKRRAVAYDVTKQHHQQQQQQQAKREPASAAATEQQQQGANNPDANLTRVEAEYVAALQAKHNAVKMMRSRLALVISYLQHLQSPPDPSSKIRPSGTILRHIQALVTNLDLVSPADRDALERELSREANDVGALALISDLVSSVDRVREAGKKFAVLELARHGRQGRGGSGVGGGGSGGGGAGPSTAFDPGLMPLSHLGEIAHASAAAGGDEDIL